MRPLVIPKRMQGLMCGEDPSLLLGDGALDRGGDL